MDAATGAAAFLWMLVYIIYIMRLISKHVFILFIINHLSIS